MLRARAREMGLRLLRKYRDRTVAQAWSLTSRTAKEAERGNGFAFRAPTTPRPLD